MNTTQAQNELDPVFADIHEDARAAARGNYKAEKATTPLRMLGNPHMAFSTMGLQWQAAYDQERQRLIRCDSSRSYVARAAALQEA